MRSMRWLVLACALTVTGVAVTETAPDEFVPPDGLADGWYARFDTSMGEFVARLLPEQAPQAVAHFAALAEGRLEWFDQISGKTEKRPYYKGIRVHMAIAGQRFEAGDPYGTGRGTPQIHVPHEARNGPVDFDRAGRLGMTRGPNGQISGAQFFATAAPQPKLNLAHPCFGAIVSGLEVVTNITQSKTFSNRRPMEPPVIESVQIFSVGDPEPLPEPVHFRPTLDAPVLRRESAPIRRSPGHEGGGGGARR